MICTIDKFSQRNKLLKNFILPFDCITSIDYQMTKAEHLATASMFARNLGAFLPALSDWQ